MEIKPTYVTFEQAKILKEKGFDEITDTIFMTNHGSEVIFENINGLKHSDGVNPFVSRPEQWQVVEWLRVNHDIDIIVVPSKTFKNTKYYFYEVTKNVDEISKTQDLYSEILEKCHQEVPGNYVNHDLFEIKVFEMGFAFNLPQEAYSAAFDYILNNNLI